MNDSEIQERLEAEQDVAYQWVVPVSYQTNVEDFPTQYLILNKTESEFGTVR